MIETKCLLCDKAVSVERSLSHESIPVAHNATVWRSHGNYGSSVYDPVRDPFPQFLEVYVCDTCLRSKVESVQHVQIIRNLPDAIFQSLGDVMKDEAAGHPVRS